MEEVELQNYMYTMAWMNMKRKKKINKYHG